MNTNIKKYAGVFAVSAVLIAGIASAAITPIPSISNTLAVNGSVVKSTDVNKLAQAINILDARTNGSQDFDFGSKKGINLAEPTTNTDAATKQYVDNSDGWIDVPLTDTSDFDGNCTYRNTNAAHSGYAIMPILGPTELRITDDWDHNGIIESIIIRSTNKSQYEGYWWNGASTDSTTGPVVKLEKNCSL